MTDKRASDLARLVLDDGTTDGERLAAARALAKRVVAGPGAPAPPPASPPPPPPSSPPPPRAARDRDDLDVAYAIFDHKDDGELRYFFDYVHTKSWIAGAPTDILHRQYLKCEALRKRGRGVLVLSDVTEALDALKSFGVPIPERFL